MDNGNGQIADVEARLRAAAEAQVQEQLAALRAGAAPAPVPGPPVAQPYAGQTFAPAPAPAVPAQSPPLVEPEAADFEALAFARFLEWTANDGRSVFVDPAAIVALEAHATAPVCKLYSVTGAVVTVHGHARDVATRLQLAAQAQRDLAAHLESERWRAMGAAIVAALADKPAAD